MALSFAKGSAALPAQSDPLLTDLVAEMQGIEHLRLLRIVGNSVEGEPEALGKERAVAVRNWLTAHGIAESMVEAVGDQGGSDALVVFEPVGC